MAIRTAELAIVLGKIYIKANLFYLSSENNLHKSPDLPPLLIQMARGCGCNVTSVFECRCVFFGQVRVRDFVRR